MDRIIHFAPLQGYTDQVYREAHAQVFGGVETYYTPFVRFDKGSFRNKDVRDISGAACRKAHVVPQLIAATPDEFRSLVDLFAGQGYPGTDINLGCPFPMQARLHRGAGLLPYPQEVESLLRVVEEYPDMQFSVKLRLGWNSPDEGLALLPLLNALPFLHITLHPRIGIQQYKGKVDLDGFSRFYENCNHPLFYNGDLTTLADISSVGEQFPRLHGVMLGRGLLAYPWLATEYISGSLMPETEKRMKLETFHALLTDGYKERLEGGEHQILAKLQTLWDYLLPDAEKKWLKKITKSKHLQEYLEAADTLFRLYRIS